MQYASLAKGDTAVSERLAQDLLFFCSQAVSARASDTPVLSGGRALGLRPEPLQAGGLRTRPVRAFRSGPAGAARKRITSAKETWSSLSGATPTNSSRWPTSSAW
jgi:chemosensory pili system protein ChpA (sensor histidine kinase/response regulator)